MTNIELKRLLRLLRENLKPDPAERQLAETLRDWSRRLDEDDAPAAPNPEDSQRPAGWRRPDA